MVGGTWLWTIGCCIGMLVNVGCMGGMACMGCMVWTGPWTIGMGATAIGAIVAMGAAVWSMMGAGAGAATEVVWVCV